jgi:hypothetical protein
MITWHSSAHGDLTAHCHGLTIRISEISDDTGRVALQVATTDRRVSAGWILKSTAEAIRHVQYMIDHLPILTPAL